MEAKIENVGGLTCDDKCSQLTNTAVDKKILTAVREWVGNEGPPPFETCPIGGKAILGLYEMAHQGNVALRKKLELVCGTCPLLQFKTCLYLASHLSVDPNDEHDCRLLSVATRSAGQILKEHAYPLWGKKKMREWLPLMNEVLEKAPTNRVASGMAAHFKFLFKFGFTRKVIRGEKTPPWLQDQIAKGLDASCIDKFLELMLEEKELSGLDLFMQLLDASRDEVNVEEILETLAQKAKTPTHVRSIASSWSFHCSEDKGALLKQMHSKKTKNEVLAAAAYYTSLKQLDVAELAFLQNEEKFVFGAAIDTYELLCGQEGISPTKGQVRKKDKTEVGLLVLRIWCFGICHMTDAAKHDPAPSKLKRETLHRFERELGRLPKCLTTMGVKKPDLKEAKQLLDEMRRRLASFGVILPMNLQGLKKIEKKHLDGIKTPEEALELAKHAIRKKQFSSVGDLINLFRRLPHSPARSLAIIELCQTLQNGKKQRKQRDLLSLSGFELLLEQQDLTHWTSALDLLIDMWINHVGGKFEAEQHQIERVTVNAMGWTASIVKSEPQYKKVFEIAQFFLKAMPNNKLRGKAKRRILEVALVELTKAYNDPAIEEIRVNLAIAILELGHDQNLIYKNLVESLQAKTHSARVRLLGPLCWTIASGKLNIKNPLGNRMQQLFAQQPIDPLESNDQALMLVCAWQYHTGQLFFKHRAQGNIDKAAIYAACVKLQAKYIHFKAAIDPFLNKEPWIDYRYGVGLTSFILLLSETTHPKAMQLAVDLREQLLDWQWVCPTGEHFLANADARLIHVWAIEGTPVTEGVRRKRVNDLVREGQRIYHSAPELRRLALHTLVTDLLNKNTHDSLCIAHEVVMYALQHLCVEGEAYAAEEHKQKLICNHLDTLTSLDGAEALSMATDLLFDRYKGWRDQPAIMGFRRRLADKIVAKVKGGSSLVMDDDVWAESEELFNGQLERKGKHIFLSGETPLFNMNVPAEKCLAMATSARTMKEIKDLGMITRAHLLGGNYMIEEAKINKLFGKLVPKLVLSVTDDENALEWRFNLCLDLLLFTRDSVKTDFDPLPKMKKAFELLAILPAKFTPVIMRSADANREVLGKIWIGNFLKGVFEKTLIPTSSGKLPCMMLPLALSIAVQEAPNAEQLMLTLFKGCVNVRKIDKGAHHTILAGVAAQVAEGTLSLRGVLNVLPDDEALHFWLVIQELRKIIPNKPLETLNPCNVPPNAITGERLVQAWRFYAVSNAARLAELPDHNQQGLRTCARLLQEHQKLCEAAKKMKVSNIDCADEVDMISKMSVRFLPKTRIAT